jgi:hypothetical protein
MPTSYFNITCSVGRKIMLDSCLGTSIYEVSEIVYLLSIKDCLHMPSTSICRQCIPLNVDLKDMDRQG